jgi:ABC-type multidrug transport system fused ATPase/permease subunit
MKWYSKLAIYSFITLAGAALVYAGFAMLGPNGGRSGGLGIFALLIGLFVAFFGLAFLFYKPSSGYEMPLPDQRAPAGPASEEMEARAQR